MQILIVVNSDHKHSAAKPSPTSQHNLHAWRLFHGPPLEVIGISMDPPWRLFAFHGPPMEVIGIPWTPHGSSGCEAPGARDAQAGCMPQRILYLSVRESFIDNIPTHPSRAHSAKWRWQRPASSMTPPFVLPPTEAAPRTGPWFAGPVSRTRHRGRRQTHR